MTIKAVELMVSGKVQRVGYREFVAEIAQELKLAGFVENLKDGTVRIWCKGEAAIVEKFEELITVKNPPEAPLICVKAVAERKLEEKQITENGFEEKYDDTNTELAHGLSTGRKYMNLDLQILRVDLGKKIDGLGNKIDSGFGKMDKNFERLEGKTEQFRTDSNTNFQVLGDKYGKISTTLERMDKNIEKMATEKKGIF